MVNVAEPDTRHKLLAAFVSARRFVDLLIFETHSAKRKAIRSPLCAKLVKNAFLIMTQISS